MIRARWRMHIRCSHSWTPKKYHPSNPIYPFKLFKLSKLSIRHAILCRNAFALRVGRYEGDELSPVGLPNLAWHSFVTLCRGSYRPWQTRIAQSAIVEHAASHHSSFIRLAWYIYTSGVRLVVHLTFNPSQRPWSCIKEFVRFVMLRSTTQRCEQHGQWGWIWRTACANARDRYEMRSAPPASPQSILAGMPP